MKTETGIMTEIRDSQISLTNGISIQISSKTGIRTQTGMKISGIAVLEMMIAIGKAVTDGTVMGEIETNAV